MTELNLVHLKRAIYYVPECWNRITFNTNNEVIREINGKQHTGYFEFYPKDYDYSIRNEKIDTAFSYFLEARNDKQFDRVVLSAFLDKNTNTVHIRVDGVTGNLSRPLYVSKYTKTPNLTGLEET